MAGSRKKPAARQKPAARTAGTSAAKPARGKAGAEQDGDDLWHRVAQTITPLPSTTERLAEMERLARLQATLAPSPAAGQPPGKTTTGRSGKQPRQTMRPQTLLTPAPAPPAPVMPTPDVSAPAQARGRVAGLDRRTAERFRKGAFAIDSRLDLHGLNREQAHMALRQFVRQHHAAGARCLLVITGKGGRGRQVEDNPYATPEPPGRLKREVPGWLASPDLAPMILATAKATPRDGGGGALYILLRRRRDDRS